MMNERKALLKWFVVQVLYNVRTEEGGIDEGDDGKLRTGS